MPRLAPARIRPGFTLMELLMVIGIITILIVLGVSVAHKVTGTGKKAVTVNALQALDTALNAYIGHKGSAPPAWVADPRPNNPTNTAGEPTYVIPVIDGRNFSGNNTAIVNSVGLFILQCKESPEANAALKDLDPKIVREFDPDDSTPTWTLQPQLATAFDGWGNPIRYVHPTFKGLVYQGTPDLAVDLNQPGSISPAPPGRQYQISQVRRNTTYAGSPPFDSDGGVSTSNRPYFYSCGPDGDPATTDDNIYLVAPRFQKAP